MTGIANTDGTLHLGGGAQFWAYISPQDDTPKYVTRWEVRLEQQDGNWSDSITSENPTRVLKTPGLSGVFHVRVTASGPALPEKQLSPASFSKPDVGCNSNCSAMIGIVSTRNGEDAEYWTTWDAVCSN